MTSTVLLPDSGSMGAWLLAARPQTLPVAVAPVAVGTAVASTLGPVRWGAVAAALIGALAIRNRDQLTNDVFDHEKGADTAERLGPTRAVQSGLLSAPAVKIGIIVAFVAAFLAGVYLATVAGAPIVVIGIASILSGIAYTRWALPARLPRPGRPVRAGVLRLRGRRRHQPGRRRQRAAPRPGSPRSRWARSPRRCWW